LGPHSYICSRFINCTLRKPAKKTISAFSLTVNSKTEPSSGKAHDITSSRGVAIISLLVFVTKSSCFFSVSSYEFLSHLICKKKKGPLSHFQSNPKRATPPKICLFPHLADKHWLDFFFGAIKFQNPISPKTWPIWVAMLNAGVSIKNFPSSSGISILSNVVPGNWEVCKLNLHYPPQVICG